MFGRLSGILRHLNPLARRRLLREQNRFLLSELRRINEATRRQLLGEAPAAVEDAEQTRSSFDFQWREMPTGLAMSDDPSFMATIGPQICRMTDLPADWFAGKRVADIGCGAGRFSHGLLSLGASVTACDQSPSALERTAALCKPFAERLVTRRIDLLKWDEEADFDLAFCFGVVHHTGNTYLAIRNAARKVRQGGRLFLMVYGFPEKLADFIELNAYQALRDELRLLSFEDRKRVLVQRCGAFRAHGWFDAVSPRINDLLTFDDLSEFLAGLGFGRARRTLPNRNHHLVADRIQPAGGSA